ncbi:MAG: phosphoribosyl-ATP diphosphatase [Neisseriaceae bacterium]
MKDLSLLGDLTHTIEDRKSSNASDSYVASLFRSGQDQLLKKVIEEAGEVLIASKNQESSQIVYEVADLLFHLMVLLSYHGLSMQEVLAELGARQTISGFKEKSFENASA